MVTMFRRWSSSRPPPRRSHRRSSSRPTGLLFKHFMLYFCDNLFFILFLLHFFGNTTFLLNNTFVAQFLSQLFYTIFVKLFLLYFESNLTSQWHIYKEKHVLKVDHFGIGILGLSEFTIKGEHKFKP